MNTIQQQQQQHVVTLQQQQQQNLNALQQQHHQQQMILMQQVSAENSLQQMDVTNNTILQQQLLSNNSLQQQMTANNTLHQQQHLLSPGLDSNSLQQQQHNLLSAGATLGPVQWASLNQCLNTGVSSASIATNPGQMLPGISSNDLSHGAMFTNMSIGNQLPMISVPGVSNIIINGSSANNIGQNTATLLSRANPLANSQQNITMLNCNSLPSNAAFIASSNNPALQSHQNALNNSALYQSNTVVSNTIINTTIVNNIVPVATSNDNIEHILSTTMAGNGGQVTLCLDQQAIMTTESAPYIPRLIDGPVKDGNKVQPKTWTAGHVATFLENNDCATYASNFCSEVSGRGRLRHLCVQFLQ